MAPDVASAAASAAAAANGGTSAALDSQVVALLRTEVAQRQVRVDELAAELDELRPVLKRYQRVLAQLTGEPSAAKPRRKRGRPRSATPGVSDERLNEIKDAILKVTQRQDEFRQADILAEGRWGSGPVAIAFEHLRRENVIRLARQDPRGVRGGGKWYRLTRKALTE